jgi:hypothetical protein
VDLVHVAAPANVADAPTKFLVVGPGQRRVGFALCSSPVAPDHVARGTTLAREAAARLGAVLGSVVLLPLDAGQAGGLSYAITPFCRPLAAGRLIGRLERRRFGQRVLAWLRAVTSATARPASAAEVADGFVAPIRFVERLPGASPRVRSFASDALRSLEDGTWTPRSVLVHGDLWIGNVLKDDRPLSDGRAGFVLVDWGAARPEGPGVYDLVRLARSVDLPRRRLLREARHHAHALDCRLRDLPSYLAAALGAIGLDPGHFPVERLLALAESTFQSIGFLAE